MKNNISLNDAELNVALNLIKTFEKNSLIYDERNVKPSETTGAYLKRLERKFNKALDDKNTVFV